MRRLLMGDVNYLRAVFAAPPGEVMGTPGLLARIRWGDSTDIMRNIFLSMTPPISVQNNDAISFIEDCISGQVTERLTENDVRKGELIQLYVISYRHESPVKTERISRPRLQKVVEVIRSHVTDCEQHYYSIWIDSLLPREVVDPLADWSDIGLSPYSFCYVVACPSYYGFEADLTRAWIRCEHQLAVTSRGILLHPSEERPSWSIGRKERSGTEHIHIRGGNLESRFSMRALAIAISYGLLQGASVSFERDLRMLKRWAMRTVCSKWPSLSVAKKSRNLCPYLPGPIAVDARVRECRMERLLFNVSYVSDLGTGKVVPVWDIIGPIRMVRHEGAPRRWHTGCEIARALCADMKLSEEDGFIQEIFTKIAGSCIEYVVLCESSIRGLVVCRWYRTADHLLLDVEMTQDPNGSKLVTGYAMVHSSKLRSRHRRLDYGLGMNQLVGYEVCGKLLKKLTRLYYSKMGVTARDMYRADASTWMVVQQASSLLVRT